MENHYYFSNANANANANASASAKVLLNLLLQQKPTQKPKFGFQNSNLAITRRPDGLRSSRFQLSAYVCTLFLGETGPMAQFLQFD